MDYKAKLAGLETAMEVKKRADDSQYTCFSDKAPEDLKDLFLEHYEVRDVDYKIFSDAIDTYVEAWNNNEDSPALLMDYIEENYSEWANPYTSILLSYLDSRNDDEIGTLVKDYECSSVSQACAIWYDERVKEAIIIIHDYVTKK